MSTFSPEAGNTAPGDAPPGAAIAGPVAAHIAFVMELTLVPLLLSAIREDFNLSIADLTWVFNAYGFAVAIGVLAGGWFGDAFNLRRVFICGVALFGAGSLLVAGAGSFEALVLGRVAQGLGAGIFSPLVPILLTRAAPDKPGRTLIVWGSVAGYVTAFAPLLYGYALSGYGWTLAFFLLAALAVVSLMAQVAQPESAPRATRPAPGRRWAVFLQSRNLWLTYVYVFCTYGSITYYLFRLPVWLSNNEIGATGVGLVLAITGLSFAGVSTLLRNMVDRPHLPAIMLAAPGLIAVGVPLSFLGGGGAVVTLSAVLVGAGLACSNAPSTQAILRFAPTGMTGLATSLDITFARLGGVASVAVLAGMTVVHSACVVVLMCLAAAICAVISGRCLGQGPDMQAF